MAWKLSRPPYQNDDGTWSIPLTKGQFAIIDAIDMPVVGDVPWQARRDGKTWYAQRAIWTGDRVTSEHMARVIMNAPAGMQVDHIDGNGLNNRRSNLRLCTRQQNSHNTPVRSDNLSGFKGVRTKPNGRYQVVVNGRSFGYFPDPVEAARAYDEAARRVFGEFARLNFPD